MQRFELEDGALLDFDPAWLVPAEAVLLFDALSAELAWEARTIRIFGREVMQPRLVAWHGDPEAVYTYSGVQNLPRPWTPTLARVRRMLGERLGLSFNSVLANLYRDGRDAMGMHSDAEPELGDEPVIASLSLGGVRTFRLRHRKGKGHAKLDLPLPSGSLLVMRGTTQRYYRHGVPREPEREPSRINLTFRTVLALPRAPRKALETRR